MNIAKNLLTPLLALCLAILCIPAASAAIPAPNPDLTGSIILHSIAVEDTGAHTTPATGEEQVVSGEPLANIRYTVTRVADDTTQPTGAQPVTGDDAYQTTQATNQNGRAAFTGLALGVYLVHQEDSASVEEPVADFLVEIPMTGPGGNTRIYDVNVYPKYQLLGPPAVNAFVTSPTNKYESVGLGESAEWLIEADIPADIGAAQGYVVRSTFHDHLAYVEDSAEVYALGAGERRTTLTGSDYTAVAENQTLTVTITENGLATLGGTQADTPTLYVSYRTALNLPQDAPEKSLATPLEIDAALDYTNQLGRTTTSTATGEKPYVYTGGANIVNVAASGGAAVAGATFKLYRTQDDAWAETNAVQAPGGGDWTATSNSEGLAAFHGLAYGGTGLAYTEGSASYYLVQTQSPSGYNLLSGPVEITVDAGSHMDDNAVTVRARSGFLLPATGGMGTVWFTVIGLLVIALAVYLFWRSRRRSGKDDHAA